MKIENGFIIGKDWNKPNQELMINTRFVERIVIDCGNMPKANRIYFADGKTNCIDLLA